MAKNTEIDINKIEASRDMSEGSKSIKQYIYELIDGNLPKLFDLNLDLERSFKCAFNWIDNS